MKKEIFNKYVEQVCKRFGITPDILFKKTKRPDVADARHLLYYLCNKRRMKYTMIQEYMQENGYKIFHSSIIYGVSSYIKKMAEDRDYIKIAKDIEQSV